MNGVAFAIIIAALVVLGFTVEEERKAVAEEERRAYEQERKHKRKRKNIA